MEKKNDIAGVTPGEMDRLAAIFAAEPRVSEVVLYGSRAKGTHRPGSDIDLTIKGSALTTGWLMDLSSRIDDLLLPYEVDLSVFDHIDNPGLIEHINRVGKVIFTNE
jgi:predicted nucleotidyltransferase